MSARLSFVVSAAVLLAAAPATGESRERPSCPREGDRVVVANRAVAVVSVRQGRSDIPRSVACVRATGRRVRLGPRAASPPRPFIHPEVFRVAGGLVGYAQRLIFDRGTGDDYRITIRDPRRVGVLVDTVAYDRARENDDTNGQDGVRDLELTASGRAAWIIRNPYADPPTVEVYRLRGDRRERIDAGDAIEARSLVRRGCVIRWRNGGSERTSRVC